MKKKFVVLSRSKLLFTLVILVGVLAPLLAVSYWTPVDQVTVREAGYAEYSSERHGFKFSYPLGWSIRTERDFSGGEILESVSFNSPDKVAHGFVQVMQLAIPIPEYISRAEKNMVPGFDSLEFKPTVSGDRQGFVLSYKRGSGDARAVAYEYFFKKKEKVFRFSYFYPEGRADQYTPIFETMLTSLSL